MELYTPYIPQAAALACYCATLVLIAMERVGAFASVALMLGGSACMAIACWLAGNAMAALCCLWVAMCSQVPSLLAEEYVGDGRRTCARLLAGGAQVALTLTMVAEATYNAYACPKACVVATALMSLSLCVTSLSRWLGSALTYDGSRPALAFLSMAVAYVAVRSPDRSIVVDLSVWGVASLTELAVVCCAVGVMAVAMPLALGSDGDVARARLAAPVVMLVSACAMSYLGDAAAGVAFAVALAVAMASSGTSRPRAVLSALAASAAALALSAVVPNMANAWRAWSGTMEGLFASYDQALTVAGTFSGDFLLGCGVGRMTAAMWEAPHGLAWPAMMVGSTFGVQGLATLVAVAACALFAGVRALLRHDGVVAVPFLCVASSVVLLHVVMASCGAIPDLGREGPDFLCLDASTCPQVFQALAIAVALGLDAFVCESREETVVALLPPAGTKE